MGHVRLNIERANDQMGSECQFRNDVRTMGILTENYYKDFHMYGFTRKQLQDYIQMVYDAKKTGKNIKKNSSNCWKCKRNVGSLFHMWWSCTEAKNSGMPYLRRCRRF